MIVGCGDDSDEGPYGIPTQGAEQGTTLGASTAGAEDCPQGTLPRYIAKSITDAQGMPVVVEVGPWCVAPCRDESNCVFANAMDKDRWGLICDENVSISNRPRDEEGAQSALHGMCYDFLFVEENPEFE